MAKAILVIDMPESCDMCDFVDDEQPPRYGEKTLYCGVPGMGDDVTDYIACRPDWCPLRELPERMEVCGTYNAAYYAKDGKMPSYKIGWNACLDEILKEPQNKGGASKTNPTG